MLWSGSSPLAAVRAGMWGLVMITGVAWLAISWSVLRLDSIDVARVAGPVILFGAGTEVLRALAGRRTWWLNAGMAVLFAAAGVVLLLERDSSYTTPAGLIGWYLMVRGVADVVIAAMTRDTDRIWGLLMVVGVLEAGLGFFSASPLSRTADLLVVVLGGLALLRAVADVVTALRLREVRVARAELLDLPPERAAGLAGYSAGLADYGSAPRGRPRHRATPRSAAAGLAALSTATDNAPDPAGLGRSPARSGGGSSGPAGGESADTAGGVAGGKALDTAGGGDVAMWPSGPQPTGGGGLPAAGGMPAPGYQPAAGSGDSFHEEVLRTTADLDAMLALAGVTGAGVGAHLMDSEAPQVPDTPEGVDAATDPAARRSD